MKEYLKYFEITADGICKVSERILTQERSIARVLQAWKMDEATGENTSPAKFQSMMLDASTAINDDIPIVRKLIREALVELRLINDALNERMPKDKQVPFSDLIKDQ